MSGAGCGNKTTPNPSGPTPEAPVRVIPQDKAESGLTMKLSEGTPGAEKRSPAKPVETKKLNNERVRALLNRLPKLEEKASDKTPFRFRGKSQPPPKTGEVVELALKPENASTGPAPTADGELSVLRHAPDGDVPLAPHVSITFSRPMVALSSQEQASKNVPVTLTPQPEGKWRWLGTSTLYFDPDKRMPMATEYKVEVKPEATSVDGKKLATSKSFSFTTPPPTLKSHIPGGGPVSLSPVVFMEFDQRVDADKISRVATLREGRTSVALRKATSKEIENQPDVFDRVQRASDDGRQDFVAVLRPETALKPDTDYQLTVQKGAPSSEGPRKTTSAQSFSFKTRDRLKMTKYRCGYGGWGSKCPPGQSWTIEFNNPLDDESITDDDILVDPPLPGKTIRIYDRQIYISGQSAGRTKYKVTVPASLKDDFSQALGEREEASFAVGPSEPRFFGRQGPVVLDPASKPGYVVHSINVERLKVKVHKAAPKDWPAYLKASEQNRRKTYSIPGKVVVNKTIKVSGERDRLTETFLDLSSAMNSDGFGHAIVSVEPENWKSDYKPKVFVWVQRSKLGLDAFSDNKRILAWVTELGTGKPVQGAEVEFAPTSRKFTSDGTGLVDLPLKTEVGHYLVARRGTDSIILPHGRNYWSRNNNWQASEAKETTRWFVFDDRSMYKPGETVSIKGWIRRENTGIAGDILKEIPEQRNIPYKVFGSRGNELSSGQIRTNSLGGFHLDFKIPKNANLGYARIQFEDKQNHSFQIQEFRRPEFEVSTKTSAGPFMVGTRAKVTATAAYYAGGALQNAPVQWNAIASPSNFRPPNRSDFTFGFWTPWWRSGRSESSGASKSLSGTSSPLGTHTLNIDLQSIQPPRPMSVVATASVTDVNRQTYAGTSTLLVHPSDLYVGLKREKYFVPLGTPMEVDAIVVDHDGKAHSGHEIEIKSARLEGSWKKGTYKEEEKDEKICKLTSSEKAKRCDIATPVGGRYQVTATVTDKNGRPNQTKFSFWVSGGDAPQRETVDQEEVTLIPDKETYEAGDTAQILVQMPFSPAEGLLTLRRSGIVEHRVFDAKNGSATLDVKITEGHYPNIYVQVDAVGSAKRDKGDKAPRRPAFASGTLNLKVPPKNRELTVTVSPKAKSLKPGTETAIDVSVKDAKGQAVPNAEVAVIVVDESVLALTNYQTPNPMAAFYPTRYANVSDFHMRDMITLAKRNEMQEANSEAAPIEMREADSEGTEDMMFADEAPSGALGRGAALAAPSSPRAMMKSKKVRMRSQKPNKQQQPQIALRKNFAALAVFAPEVKTDGKGSATVKVKIPDNLTRYRAIAVAAAKARYFGNGEANIVARNPIMVRPSAPRFLNFGDVFELPIAVQNQTDKAMNVELAIRATNLKLTKQSGVSVKVPANDRVEVRIPARAVEAGVARAQIVGTSGKESDAAEFSIPVWTPTTTEAFATYGVVENGVTVQAFDHPKDAVNLFGGLSISTSSTQLQELTDAFLYVAGYPYECAEQTSSRLLGLSMRDILTAFEAPGVPNEDELKEDVAQALGRLEMLQNGDGGFSFWSRGRRSWPYLTIYAALALQHAKAKGYSVNAETLRRAMEYLKTIRKHIPSYYSRESRNALVAFALWVRALSKDVDSAAAKKLWNKEGQKHLSMEALGWIVGTLARGNEKTALAEILKFLGNRVEETAGGAHWTTSYSDGAHLLLHSNRRADAIILHSLISAAPKSDLIPKVIRGLLAHRKKGRWSNTQENTFVLLAMDEYFQTYEKTPPNFTAKAWLGDRLAVEESFKGRSTSTAQVEIPMAILSDGPDKKRLTLQAKGKGRMYYRLGVTYAPKSLSLKPADYGFTVTREYEPIDSPDDVTKKDGVWNVKAGARVRVRVKMVAPSRRYHVALVDPLPAGLEPLNPALAVTGDIPEDSSSKKSKGNNFWWWSRPWYEHQNMRDERVEAFTSLLWEGIHEYTYVTRATTPGNFVVPPTRAEEMYSPETFGRSGTDKMVIQ